MPTRPRRPPTRELPGPSSLAVLAAAVLVLAGCGSGAGADGAGSNAQARAGAPSATAGADASSPGGASPGDTAGPAPATSRTVTSLTSFTSPTGNISCYLAPVEGAPPYARCDLQEVSWADPVPEPETGCAGHWGGGGDGSGVVGVGGDGEAAVLCGGDTAVDLGAEVLDYGGSITLGEITCTSRKTGMECANAATGHGFTVSRSQRQLH